MRFHRKHAEWVVGLFTLTALVLLAAALVIVGIEHEWFAGRTVYFARFERPAGLAPGAGVLVGGLPAGRVYSVQLEASGQVVVEMRVVHRYAEHVRADSVAQLRATNIVGSPTISIQAGSLTKPPMPEGEFIPTMPATSLGMADLTQLLHSGAILTGKMADPDGPLMRTIERLDRLTASISDDDRADVQRLIRNSTNLAQKLADPQGPLMKVLARLDRLTRVLDSSEADLHHQLEQMKTLTERAVSVLTQVDAIVKGQDRFRVVLTEDSKLSLTKQSHLTADLPPDLKARLDKMLVTLGKADLVLEKLNNPDNTLGAFANDRAMYNALVDLLRDTRTLVSSTGVLVNDLSRVTPMLPDLVEEAFVEMRRVREVLQSLRRNPLLRSGFSESAPMTPAELEATADPYED